MNSLSVVLKCAFTIGLLLIVFLARHTQAAFIVEAHETGLGADNFEFGGDTFSATESLRSNAVGLEAEHSIFGGDGLLEPDTYLFFYTPGEDDDNFDVAAGTILGSDDGSPGLGYQASGLEGGDSGSYNVYATSPMSFNVSGTPSLVTLTQNGDPIDLDLDMNAEATGANTQINPGGPFVGGINNAWFLLGTVEYERGQTYSVEFLAGENTFVSQRIHGILWERVSGGGPTLGDFDGDGDLDAQDIDLLTEAVNNGEGEIEFDLNTDGDVDGADRDIWVNDLRRTYYGDANLDGEFTSSDLVFVFTAGLYEANELGSADWASGDWTGDAIFDSSDFVLAFGSGGYEQGPRNVLPVPEPISMWPIGLILLARVTRTRAPQ